MYASQQNTVHYNDRQDAGKRLGDVLRHFKSKDTIILALPRGGAVLGAVVAKTLKAPLGLILVRKLAHPLQPEYAIGAVVEDEEPVFSSVDMYDIDETWLAEALEDARHLIEERRDKYYGKDFSPPEIKNKAVIIVDDGMATGLTMEASVRAMHDKDATRVIVAVPVASSESMDRLETLADELIVLDDPAGFQGAVGSHYKKFDQVDDEEVRALLREVRDDLRKTTTQNR